MIITPQALRGIYVAFNTIFNKAFEGQHPTYEKVATSCPAPANPRPTHGSVTFPA